jgi:hypothetical protein
MTELPEFRLETYVGKWEFAGRHQRHHMTASDAQTLTMGPHDRRGPADSIANAREMTPSGAYWTLKS